MPAYNASLNIGHAIDSVLKQTYENWELIIVNDCSTDNTLEIVRSYANEDDRIKVFSNEVNSKVAKTRNKAISKATGRYIAFLDSDDLWLPEKLEQQLNLMKSDEKIYFSFGSYLVIEDDGSKTGKIMKAPAKISYKNMLKGSKIGCLTVLIDRNIVSDLEFKDIGHEDYLLWLELLRDYGDAYAVTDAVACYRQGGGSLSSNKKRAAGWQFDIYRKELNIPLIPSIFYFVHYAINAFRKYEDA